MHVFSNILVSSLSGHIQCLAQRINGKILGPASGNYSSPAEIIYSEFPVNKIALLWSVFASIASSVINNVSFSFVHSSLYRKRYELISSKCSLENVQSIIPCKFLYTLLPQHIYHPAFTVFLSFTSCF